MSNTLPKDLAAPIVEAVVDIDCDMPPALNLAALEGGASAALAGRYPKVRVQHVEEHRIEARSDAEPKFSVRRGIQGLQFFQDDEKQLVQLRALGYSFNRLAPYSSLDEYLPEIERTWKIFVDLAAPLHVRRVRLRYINRLPLPLSPGSSVELLDYISTAPQRFPLEDELKFDGVLHRYAALEPGTGHRVRVTLATQPLEGERLPVILDIEATGAAPLEPQDWPGLLAKIHALRALKNRVFRSTITDKCLALFRPSHP